MAKRRRVSRATRAKISRGLQRYYRAQRAAARRRSQAAKKAAATRAARRAAEARADKTAARRHREAARAREHFGDFEDYEIEIAVDYVPAWAGR